MKDNSEYFDRFLRMIADPLAKHSVKFTPNFITFISFVMCVFAFISFFNKHYVIGGICVLLYGILDCVDGEVARLRNMQSKFGQWLDGVVGFVAYPLFIIAICYGINTKISLFIGMLAIMAFPTQYGLIYFYKNEIAESKESIPIGNKRSILNKIKYLYGSQLFNVMLFIFCLIGHPLWWLGLWAIFGNLFWVGTIFIQYLNLRK